MLNASVLNNEYRWLGANTVYTLVHFIQCIHCFCAKPSIYYQKVTPSYTELHQVTPIVYRLFFVKACLYSANSSCLTLLFRQLPLCARQLMKQHLSGMSNDILSMHENVCLLSVWMCCPVLRLANWYLDVCFFVARTKVSCSNSYRFLCYTLVRDECILDIISVLEPEHLYAN